MSVYSSMYLPDRESNVGSRLTGYRAIAREVQLL